MAWLPQGHSGNNARKNCKVSGKNVVHFCTPKTWVHLPRAGWRCAMALKRSGIATDVTDPLAVGNLLLQLKRSVLCAKARFSTRAVYDCERAGLKLEICLGILESGPPALQRALGQVRAALASPEGHWKLRVTTWAHA
jgi:hypothetical protein